MACEQSKANLNAKEATITTQMSACPACRERRVHTEEDWKLHPFRGHGVGADGKWTHPDLEAQAAAPKAAKLP